MKLFTGSLAAGLVLLAGGAQAQVPGPYGMGVRDTRRHRISARPTRWHRSRFPGRHYVPRPPLRRWPKPAAVDGSLLRAARQRILAARHPEAARLRLHDCGHRSRRRGRTAGYRRAQRPDHPLPAGLPHGRTTITYQEQSALRGPFGAQPPRPACPGRAAAVTAVLLSRAARCRCRRPARSPPSLRRRRSSRRHAPAPKPAEVLVAAPVTTGSAPAKPAPQIAPTEDMPTMQGLE